MVNKQKIESFDLIQMQASGLKRPTSVAPGNPDASAGNPPAAAKAPGAAKASSAIKAPTGLKAPTAAKASSGLKAPAAAVVKSVKSTIAPTATEPASDNDPIALTVQYREAIGGLNNQTTDIEAKAKKMKVFRSPKLVFKGTAFIDLVGGNDE